jgi:hypothetical protein
MKEELIKMFVQGYFQGVTDIEFYEQRDKRMLNICFKEVEHLQSATGSLKPYREHYFADVDNNMVVFDRDDFESIMYMVASFTTAKELMEEE